MCNLPYLILFSSVTIIFDDSSNCEVLCLMKHLVTALVLARIDSCNSVLVNLPASTIAPLQRVQNTAARLVLV